MFELERVATKGYPFLSPKWVHEVTRVVQAAQLKDKQFGELCADFSLTLAYQITDVPLGQSEQIGSPRLFISVKLDKGKVRGLTINTELPDDNADFTITSSYEVAKKIFLGELNAATAFIHRVLKVEPMSRVYRDPRFTAKAIVTANLLLKFARQVPTVFID